MSRRASIKLSGNNESMSISSKGIYRAAFYNGFRGGYTLLFPGKIIFTTDSILFKKIKLFGDSKTIAYKSIAYGKFMLFRLWLYGKDGETLAQIRSIRLGDIADELISHGIKVDLKGMRAGIIYSWLGRIFWVLLIMVMATLATVIATAFITTHF